MASFVNNLVSVEQCDKALAAFKSNLDLGLITEKDYTTKVAQVEKRKQSLANKPDFQEITPVETVLGGGTSWKGQQYQTGVFTKVNEGPKGKWVSTFFRPGYKSMCYIDTSDLKIVAEALITHIEALEAQGFKFKG